MGEFRTIIVETLRGKSLGRTLQNIEFSKLVLSGNGIDLGAKSNKSSYYRFVKLAEGVQVTFTDLRPQSPEVMRINLECEPIPVPDSSQDFLIMSSVLEHIYNFDGCVRETYRVLKAGGRLIGSIPLLVQVHPDPDDYFRFTASGINRIFSEAGYSNVSITPLTRGPFSAAASMIAPILVFKPLVALSYLVALGCDAVVTKVFKRRLRNTPEYFAINYFVVARK